MPDPQIAWDKPGTAAGSPAKIAWTAPQKPNDVAGGAGRRLIDVIKSGVKGTNPFPNSWDAQGILESPLLTGGIPFARMARGQIDAERQLGPQLVDQVKAAAKTHSDLGDSPGNPLSYNLADARAATTGLSMLNPFASASVGNVNQLQDEGRGSEAAGQGFTDATLLGAGEVLPRVPLKAAMRGAGRVMESNAPSVAEFAAHPVASVVKPVARGAISGSGRLLQRMGAEAQAPTAPAPAAPGPTARMIDVPSYGVEGSPQPPENLLDQVRATAPEPPREFDVTPTQSYSPQPLSAESGTFMRDPRTNAELLQSAANLKGGGQGKVAMQEPAPDVSELYGKNAARSNLAKNQRQMGTTAQPPVTPRFIARPNPTAEDLAFQDENMEDILAASIGQKRLLDQVRGSQ